MRLVEVKLSNFRGYANETAIAIDPLTVIVGRNDAGKSTILDALNIFFNDSTIEKDDRCVRTNHDNVQIGCVFEDLSDKLVIDEQYETTLQDEYLLREDGKLEIVKRYNYAAAKVKPNNIFARARHPTAQGVDHLHSLKISELKALAKERQADLSNTNQAIKAQLRKALWDQTADLSLGESEVSLMKESGKEVWEQLQKHFPVYALFKSDRASTDQDAEAQDPLKVAIKQAIGRREVELDGVVREIREELARVANRTVEKIREMSEDLANQLNPQVKTKNWETLFSVSLTGDEDIPINKRGSGTRRLVLLNFFRAVAEEASDSQDTGVIYAVEEPETSQHPNNQKMMLEAFEELVEQGRCQVILTTHTPTLARQVNRNALRLVEMTNQGPTIAHGSNDDTLRRIKDTLGVLADHDVRAFLGVEGKHDIQFLKRISAILAVGEADIPNLAAEETAGRLVFVPLAGSNLDLWTTTLAGLDRPEYYLTDRDRPPPDPPKYQAQLAAWAARGCTAWATSKAELENYIPLAVLAAEAPGYSGVGADFEDVPMLFAEAVHNADPTAPAWAGLTPERKKTKASAVKKRLNTVCVDRMTPAMLVHSDPNDEIRTWLRAVGVALNA